MTGPSLILRRYNITISHIWEGFVEQASFTLKIRKVTDMFLTPL